MTFCTAIVACGLFPLAQLPPLTHVDTWTQGLEHPSRLAVSPSEVLVADPQVGTITRFDLAGNFLGTWSEPAGPLGVAVHPDGRIFVARRQDAQVAVYDGSFAFQHFISAAPFGFVRPTDLTVDPSSGVLYVVDSGADRLYGFDASETLVLVIGARGSGFGQFKNPSAVAVDGANGRIFVADQDNFRVQVFSLAGIFLRSFGYRIKYLPGGVSEGWLPRTTGLSVDAAGNVYVLDALMGTLRIFDSDGGELGKVVEYGTTAGQLQRPGDVALDAAGRVYVTNSGPGSVEVYQAPLSGLLEAAPARHPLGSNASPETLEQRIISLVGSAWDRFRGGAGSDPFGPRTPPGWDPPHMLDDLNCDRCHSIDGQPEGHLGTRDGQTNLCLSCHMGAGQAAAALIRPTTNIGMSHAWAVPAVNPVFGSVGPAPGGPLEPYLSNGDIKCATCHNQHNHDAAAPYLRAPADAMCQECHANHTIHTPAGSWQPTCTECHVAHDPDDRNLSLVAATVRNLTLGVDKAVVFTARTGPNSFDDGDPAANDGICQVCHTATTYHTHDGSGAPHNNGATCTTCHPHDAGFLPTGGDCTACHASPQDNGDNVPPGGRRAVVGEFPVDNTHAHYGATLTNDACTTCHDMTTHMDGYVDLVDPDDGSLYTFVKPEDLASDPDVSNFCMGCHDADGAARLADPFDPFGGGNAAPDVATRLQGTLQWDQEYGDFCFGTEGTLRPVNSHHDISDADQAFSGAKLECLNCHGAHTAAASQPVSDPFDTHTPWTGTSRDFCLACHAGGSGPVDPGFPLGVMGPVIDVNDPRWVDLGVDWCKILDGACQAGDCSALRGLDSCEYGEAPWYVDYSWQHSAHGPNSKRGWADYSGAPSADLDCQVCHDPHGSYSATNPAGNPYMIRDFVDGTAFVDDGYRVGANWTGPPWDTFGIAREVMVSVSGLDVGWGAAEGLCAVCHADWLSAQHFHDFCTGCQTCHGHGMAWGEYDWGSGNDDDTPCPFNDACGRAAQLTPGVGAIGDNTIAKDSNAPFCGTDSPLNGLWYWVVGTGNTLTVTTCLPGTTFDTRLQVFCDCQTLDCIGGNDDDAACGSSGTSSTVSWCSDPDQIYYIHVGSAGPAAGVFELMVSDNGVPCGTAAVCQPEIGACCVNQVTVANNTRTECDALGGTWYVGEDCASFACPTTPSPMFEDAVEDSRSMSNGQNTGRSTSVPGDRPRPPLHFGKRP